MERRQINITKLEFDLDSPRFFHSNDQNDAFIKIVNQNGGRNIIGIAKDIVENGLSPTWCLLVATPTAKDDHNFVVIDGNRRLAALRILAMPSILDDIGSIKESLKIKLRLLAEKHYKNDNMLIDVFVCKSVVAARHWASETGGQRGGDLAQYFVTAIFIASVCAGLVPGIFYHKDHQYFAEYFSYDFASIAAVLAGLGLYFRHEQMWFWISGILVFAGLISFVYSEPGYVAVFILFISILGIFNGIILSSIRIQRTKNKPFNLRSSIANVACYSLALIGLLASSFSIANLVLVKAPEKGKDYDLECPYINMHFSPARLKMVCNTKESENDQQEGEKD